MARPGKFAMRLGCLILSAIFILPSLCFSAKPKTYHYEPETVELVGVMELQTFPGRPGYESIKKGDEVERCFYLRLTLPIEVDASDNNNENSESEKNVKTIQLTSYLNAVKAKARRVIGKVVTVRGQLFHGYSAHHHARVLMKVDMIEVTKR